MKIKKATGIDRFIFQKFWYLFRRPENQSAFIKII